MSNFENIVLNVNDLAVRASYNHQVFELFRTQYAKQAFEIHHNQECIAEILAREASDSRASIKDNKQEETSDKNQEEIDNRNEQLYGNAKGPTFNALMAKKTSEEIFYSSFKTGGKDLGLESNEMEHYINATKNARVKNPDSNLYSEQFLFYEMRQSEPNILADILGDEDYNLFEQYLPTLREVLGEYSGIENEL